jgi:hypothetical protein
MIARGIVTVARRRHRRSARADRNQRLDAQIVQPDRGHAGTAVGVDDHGVDERVTQIGVRTVMGAQRNLPLGQLAANPSHANRFPLPRLAVALAVNHRRHRLARFRIDQMGVANPQPHPASGRGSPHPQRRSHLVEHAARLKTVLQIGSGSVPRGQSQRFARPVVETARGIDPVRDDLGVAVRSGQSPAQRTPIHPIDQLRGRVARPQKNAGQNQDEPPRR